MAEQPVRVVYDVQGAAEGAAAIDALKRATLEHAASAEGGAQSTEGYERALATTSAQVAELKTRQDAANASTNAASQGFGTLAQQGVALAQRFAGVANAAAGLLDRLGGPGSGGGAHLFGSIASNVAQFSSLGMMLGPGGALLGGLAGAALAIHELADANDRDAESARAHATALMQVVTAARAVRAQSNIDASIAEGGPVLATSGIDDSALAMAAESRMARITELEREADGLQEIVTRNEGSLLGDLTVDDRMVEASIARVREIGDEIARVRGELANIGTETGRREGEAIASENAGTGHGTSGGTSPARGGGGGGGAEDRVAELAAIYAQWEATEDAFYDAREARIASFYDEINNESAEAVAERINSELNEHEAGWNRRVAMEQEKQDLLVSIAEEAAEAKRLAMMSAEERAREAAAAAAQDAQEEAEARIMMIVDMGSSLAKGLGGAFMSAFEGAIEGQEDFGQAMAKGTKQLLMQFGMTMVAEGIGALFTGIGNTILNPPAAAAKYVEGAGKIALGVGLGATGAAIPTGGGAPPAPRAERPRVDQAPGGSGAAAGPMIVHLNAPTILGGTDAEVGRLFERVRVAGVRRFGSEGGDR